ERVWIYTQDRPFTGRRIYAPIRNPDCNESNYRTVVSRPRWIERDEPAVRTEPRPSGSGKADRFWTGAAREARSAHHHGRSGRPTPDRAPQRGGRRGGRAPGDRRAAAEGRHGPGGGGAGQPGGAGPAGAGGHPPRARSAGGRPGAAGAATPLGPL